MASESVVCLFCILLALVCPHIIASKIKQELLIYQSRVRTALEAARKQIFLFGFIDHSACVNLPELTDRSSREEGANLIFPDPSSDLPHQHLP